ncbi:MAG: class I SAM-dependent methyltransferase [Solirubrobacterales bacterium]
MRRVRDWLRGTPARFAAAGDRLVFPEEKSSTGHWQRLVLNAAVDQYIAALSPSDCTAVEISGDSHAGRPWREYTELTYPDFDLCEPLRDAREFDVVICEQVLEHVPDPWGAAANLRRLCAPGGHVIVSTPFLVRVHELELFAMRDYWRFTPRGLGTLLEGAGFELEALGSWGNRQCVVGNFNRWSARRRWHSLRNEPEFPVQVWAFARRASGSA